jgi:hypothetical protein
MYNSHTIWVVSTNAPVNILIADVRLSVSSSFKSSKVTTDIEEFPAILYWWCIQYSPTSTCDDYVYFHILTSLKTKHVWNVLQLFEVG